MKIGVSSASLYPMAVEDSLRAVGESGIKYTEVFLNTFSEMKPEFVSELCRIKESYGIEIVSLHPFTSGYEPYLLSRDYPRRYKDGIEFYKKLFSVAGQLGARIFVLHGDRYSPNKNVYEYCEHFNRLSHIAEASGILLTQENVNKFCASDPEFIRGMINNLGNRAMFTFDIKQSIRSGFGTWEVYDAMRGHIAHIHLSDNDEKRDCLLPGNGTFSFEKLFRIAESDGYSDAALIEVYSNSYVTVEQLKKSCDMLVQKYNSVL